MDIHRYWEKALRQTEIVRPRIQPLETFDVTPLPYVLLSESLSDSGNTVVRKGQVMVEKPTLVLPPNIPQLEGFEWEEGRGLRPDSVMDFLLVRGVRFPSLKFQNETFSLSIYDGRLSKAVEEYLTRLQKQENVTTGLVIGPEDCWQFSLLLFVGGQVLRSADGDIKRLRDFYRRNS